MSKYRVSVNGENFLLEFDGRPQKVGFYVWRTIEADNPEEAENSVIEIVRNDSRLKGLVLNERDDSPILYAEEIEEVSTPDPDEELNTGFSWYTEGEE
jgi:hypothetical protein